MLDLHLRRLQRDLFDGLARRVGAVVSPGALTWFGAGLGLAAAWCAFEAYYGWGLFLFGLNRFLDGLDGSVARVTGRQTDLGGYLDIVLDFGVYAAVVIGLALGRPAAEGVLPVAALLLGLYYVNAGGWMYLSAILEKRGAGARERGEPTTVRMPEGLIGGTETMFAYALFFIFPGRLRLLFMAFGLLIALTVLQRLEWARRHLR